MKPFRTKTFLFLLLAVCIFCSACKQDKNQDTNKYIIELVGNNFDKTKIQTIAKEYGASDSQLYQWKNHLVLYTELNQVQQFSKQLTKQFPKLQVKIYEKPFYNYSKSKHCGNAEIAAKWKHILLTANLVEDEKLQQEYLEYHRTQFEEWPEIAEGFCNADFQQLLVYRNGSQLMLVISIPANKTLDELNPKTVENNPRMDEWNQIMGKYQKGIEGTKPDEKWVFLNKTDQ